MDKKIPPKPIKPETRLVRDEGTRNTDVIITISVIAIAILLIINKLM